MANPPYHLRTNKAVDRLLFIETLHRFATENELSTYTYYSFGGPFLDDFRLMHEHFPKMRMVSIEQDYEVYKRQKFHQPSGFLQLINDEFQNFLSLYEAKRKKSIFWLDYTKLDLNQFNEFVLLLSKVAEGSMVKITLRARAQDYQNKSTDPKNDDGTYKVDKNEEFRRKFQDFLPSSSQNVPTQKIKFARLLQEMIHIASQRGLPSTAGDLIFQPISSFFYEDGAGILTLTGVICKQENQKDFISKFENWPYANLDLKVDPIIINVPILSAKERFHLQKYLPCKGKSLVNYLKYGIGGSEEETEKQMEQYAEFYRQYPYFIRAMV